MGPGALQISLYLLEIKLKLLSILCVNKRKVLILCIKKSWLIFDAAGHKSINVSSELINILISEIISGEGATSHKYLLQDGRSKLRAILEMVGNSALIPN